MPSISNSAICRSKNLLPQNDGNLDIRFLDSKGAAAFLEISLHQLYKLSSSGFIAKYKPAGKKLYFLKEDLEKWIFSGERGTMRNISEKATMMEINNYLLNNI